MRLREQARRALAAGALEPARDALDAATRLEPRDPSLWLQLAGVSRALGQLTGALTAVDAALAIDPLAWMALLLKGSLLEQAQSPVEAATHYGRALMQIPPNARVDAATRAAIEHARKTWHAHVEALSAHVHRELAGSRAPARPFEQHRIDLFIDATLGTRRIYRQQPTEYEYPGLPAIEFHDRDAFPWLPTLEAATDAIRRELLAVVGSPDAEAGFEPYVAYPDGVPLAQWVDLNRSPAWSAFHLFHRGRRYDDNAKHCPDTMALLATLPQPQAPGRMPAAMFSRLAPRTRIPAHTGVANVRLVVHLPLIVPPGCGFRVGNETRVWQEGAAWVFDDTIEHEAWNDSDRDRYVFIFDVWNPALSATERQLISAVMTAMDSFRGTTPDGGL